MKDTASNNSPKSTVISLAQLLAEQPASPPPGWIEPGLLPPQGILFVGGEPKVGKSLLVANLALSLAAGKERAGFTIPAARRVNREASALFACGQRKSEIGHQQALADLGFASHKQNALGRQQSRLDPAGRRRGGLLGEQLRQRNYCRFRRVVRGRVFHSNASEVASSSSASFTSCIL